MSSNAPGLSTSTSNDSAACARTTGGRPRTALPRAVLPGPARRTAPGGRGGPSGTGAPRKRPERCPRFDHRCVSSRPRRAGDRSASSRWRAASRGKATPGPTWSDESWPRAGVRVPDESDRQALALRQPRTGKAWSAAPTTTTTSAPPALQERRVSGLDRNVPPPAPAAAPSAAHPRRRPGSEDDGDHHTGIVAWSRARMSRMPTIDLKIACQRCRRAQMEMKDPAADGGLAPTRTGCARECGRHFWST